MSHSFCDLLADCVVVAVTDTYPSTNAHTRLSCAHVKVHHGPTNRLVFAFKRYTVHACPGEPPHYFDSMLVNEGGFTRADITQFYTETGEWQPFVHVVPGRTLSATH